MEDVQNRMASDIFPMYYEWLSSKNPLDDGGLIAYV